MFSKFSRQLKISHRLLGGFGVVLMLLTAVVGTTVWKTAEIKKSTALIVESRVPSALAHAQLINSINGSLAALRGYLLTGDPKFKTERAIEWKNIATLHKKLDRYSTEWTNPENPQKMRNLKKAFREFKRAQAEVENIARSKAE